MPETPPPPELTHHHDGDVHHPGATTPIPARTAGDRLVGVDATRGVALLGMMAVHALWAYDDNGELTWHYALAAGRSAATFALLAGVGIAFITRRRPVPRGARKPTAASLAARAGVIGGVGLALGWTDAELATVILVYYALLFVLAIPLVFLSTRLLLALAATTALGVPLLSHWVRPVLPAPAEGNVSLEHLFDDPVGLLLQLTLTGQYPAVPWMAYICLGIAVGRMPLSSPLVARRLLAAGSAAALGAWALSQILLGPLGGTRQLYASAPASGLSRTEVNDILLWGGGGITPTDTWWWLATIAPHTSTPLDLIHTAGVAVALLGAMLLLAHRPTTILAPIAAAGSMTLTLYTAHIVFLNSPWDGFEATTGYLVQVIAALGFALAWRAAVGRGPLETLAAEAAGRARQAVHPVDPPVKSRP